MSLAVVILAAGQGTRMCSQRPKVLHEIAGKPLLAHVLDSVAQLNPDETHVVYGHQGEYVKHAMQGYAISWVEQTERLGTGHAVKQVLPVLGDVDQCLILCGDVPLISSETLQHFVESTGSNQLGLLTAELDNPKGLGRIIRDDYHQVQAIIEDKDATEAQKQIKEINAGIYCIPTQYMSVWLNQLNNDNAQGEYYLTDVVKLARSGQVPINVSEPKATYEIMGVNTRRQQAELERLYQKQVALNLMRRGVTLIDPQRIDVRGDLTIAQDVVIDVNVILSGQVKIGAGSSIGANSILKDCTLGDNVVIHPNTLCEGATIESGAQLGPFARIRPDSSIGANAKVGNFVEIKKSTLGAGTKAGHLSYIGDAELGANVNIGAGTITCNYDGANKHKTTIEDNAFIGSNTSLVAPVTIGEGATVGASSAVSKDVESGGLVVSRSPQKYFSDWLRPQKND